jgi:leader peptidase (prepilin peptidase)/N-methyltransferase
VNAQLIAGASVTGLVVGGLLDPLGQRLAERSVDEQRRRDDLQRRSDGVDGGLSTARSPDALARPPRLLPVGVSPVRTAGAAVVTAVLSAGGANRFGAHLVLVPFTVFFAVLVVVSTTDLSNGLIPRRLVYPGLVAVSGLLGAVAAVDGQWHRLATAATGSVAAFAVFFVIWWLAPRGIGFGDVRLSALIGLATGWIGLIDVYLAVVSAFVLGLLGGVATTLLRGTGRRTRIPFAPALAAGAVVAVLWGAPIVHAIFHQPI